MKVRVRKVGKKEEEQVIVECVEMTEEVEEICSFVRSRGKMLPGVFEGRTCRFRLDEVFYFEALDEKVFAYTKDRVYEVKARLYEVEQAYERNDFVRCSKSVVLNLMQLAGISPALNGRFFAHMKNGEKLMITRQYVPALKKIVMREEGR